MKPEFQIALQALMTAFPRMDIPPATAEMWGVMSSDQDPVDLAAAAVQMGRQGKYPLGPTLGEWMAHSKAIAAGRAGVPTAGEAWEAMYRNRRRQILHKPPEWPNEACQRAAQFVRWDDPDWLVEQIPTIRAQFERYYVALVNKQSEIDERNVVMGLAPAVKALMDRSGANEPRRLIP